MSIIAWLVLGLISGFIGSKIVDNHGKGIVGDIVIGVIGALLGGFLFSLIGAAGITGFNLWSLIVTVFGSVVLCALSHTFRHSRG